MFGIGKRLTQIESLMREEEQKKEILQALESQQKTLEKLQAEQEAVRVETAKSAAALNRHDRVIEDMLDAWEELRDAQEAQINRLQSETAEERKQQTEEIRLREETLLRTVTGLYDQLFILRQTAKQTENEIWKRQIDMMADRQTEALALAGIQVIGQNGDQFSYTLYDAVETLETDQVEQEHRVAEVIRCGYVYQGKVIRKAQVAVWRLPNSET